MFAPYIHPESVLAPRIFLVCHSDDRIRTSSLVRAVTSFVVQGMGVLLQTPRSEYEGYTEYSVYITNYTVYVPRPKLFARDTDEIFHHSGVTARIQGCPNGEKTLMLRSPFTSDHPVVQHAVLQAMEFIRVNHENAAQLAVRSIPRRQRRR